jgi:hypothetical protein
MARRVVGPMMVGQEPAPKIPKNTRQRRMREQKLVQKMPIETSVDRSRQQKTGVENLAPKIRCMQMR